MSINKNYLFQSKRLGFRNWIEGDILQMAEINADAKVMAYFPSTKTTDETREFILRMQKQFLEKGFCYFAVDKLENGEFIGFIGLSEQTYESDFTPCVDIGWRLKFSEWNTDFATEGAQRCLEFAFSTLNLDRIVAVAPVANLRSEKVMINIGMKKVKEFKHPLLKDITHLEKCVLFERLAHDA